MNSWLRDNGYIVLKNPALKDNPGFFGNVDWSRTRAYALGLNGLYTNLKGREKDGVVEPSARETLLNELSTRLLGVIDPVTGKPAITRVYRSDQVYSMAGVEDIRAQSRRRLRQGHARLGRIRARGDAAGGHRRQHQSLEWQWCMDHETVPGVLLSSRVLKRPAQALQHLAAALLAESGIDSFPAAHRVALTPSAHSSGRSKTAG